MLQEDFNEKLLQAIKASEYKNIAKIARKMDIDRKAVDKWVKGDSFPSASHIAELCSILQISPDWLLCGKGKPYIKYETQDRLVPQNFTERLIEAIKNSGYSCVAHIARRLDVDRKSLIRWTKGDSMPNAYHIANLCELLGVSAKWLLYGKEDKKRRELNA